MMRMYQIDPMEGPSWLLDNRGKRRKQKPRVKKSKPTSAEVSTNGDSEAVENRSVESSQVAESLETETVIETEPIVPETRVSKPIVPDTRVSEPVVIPESANLESIPETGRPNKRRAAAAAVASLKEPSLNKKLRQGDDIFKDSKFKETKSRKTKSVGAKKLSNGDIADKE